MQVGHLWATYLGLLVLTLATSCDGVDDSGAITDDDGATDAEVPFESPCDFEYWESGGVAEFTVSGPGPWGTGADATTSADFLASGIPDDGGGIGCWRGQGGYNQFVARNGFHKDGFPTERESMNVTINPYTGPGTFQFGGTSPPDNLLWVKIVDVVMCEGEGDDDDDDDVPLVECEEEYQLIADENSTCTATVEDNNLTGSFSCTGLSHHSPTTGQQELYDVVGSWTCCEFVD